MKVIDSGFKGTQKPKHIPFSHELANAGDLSERTRLKHYLQMFRFIDHHSFLDIGEKNWVGKQIADRFNIDIDNTLECDFNNTLLTPKEKYDTIFCFEVIEHLMNPLVFLQNIHSKLNDNGVLYLSTPFNGLLSIYCCDYHVVEYKSEPLKKMFAWAGFEVVEEDVFRTFPPYFYLTGFRPVLRFFASKIQLYKLVKCGK